MFISRRCFQRAAHSRSDWGSCISTRILETWSRPNFKFRAARMTTGVDAGNPLMAHPWSAAPFSLPPLQEMKAAHFLPAFERDMQTHLAEIAAIVACNEPPTFENTVAPLDRAGSALDATSRCFGVLCASATYPELQKVEMEMAPVLANHGTSIYANGVCINLKIKN